MASTTPHHFGEAEAELFRRQGYVRLGKLLSDEGLPELQQRMQPGPVFILFLHKDIWEDFNGFCKRETRTKNF
mgnify:CR=1 FL=1